MVDLVELLDESEEACGAAETFKRSRMFMAAYLRLMGNALPQWARENLAVLELFHQGGASADEVVEARVRCWDVLRARERVPSESEQWAARALACCLWAERPPGIDMPCLVSDFLQDANKIEDHSAEIESLITPFFSGCV